MAIDRTRTDLACIPRETLLVWLRDSQQALHDLMTGSKPIVVTYTQGDGQKSVTYAKADMVMLRGYISELKAQLGITNGRRAMRPMFSGGYYTGRGYPR